MIWKIFRTCGFDNMSRSDRSECPSRSLVASRAVSPLESRKLQQVKSTITSPVWLSAASPERPLERRRRREVDLPADGHHGYSAVELLRRHDEPVARAGGHVTSGPRRHLHVGLGHA